MCDNAEACPIGRITAGIQLNTLIEHTVSFLQQQLPLWRDNPSCVGNDTAEDRLTCDLCKFLNMTSPMIAFNFQEPQAANRSVDLSVTPGTEAIYIGAQQYAYNTPFLLIEAKRLPAPPPATRKYEYVTGMNDQRGGIQRFKLGLHGVGHDSTVIIAYVQQRSCTEWQHTINAWITDLATGRLQDGGTWREGEQLKCFVEDVELGTARCESRHPRVNAGELLIDHVCVNMNHRATESAPPPVTNSQPSPAHHP